MERDKHTSSIYSKNQPRPKTPGMGGLPRPPPPPCALEEEKENRPQWIETAGKNCSYISTKVGAKKEKKGGLCN